MQIENYYPSHLLIASPHLRDPNFERTVVLLLRHDAEGALGVILNRVLSGPEGLSLSNLFDSEEDNGDRGAGGEECGSECGGGECGGGKCCSEDEEVADDGLPPQADAPLYLGGPVPHSAILLHGIPGLGQINVCEGVYCTNDTDLVNKLVEKHRDKIRFYLGHAGWESKQLESELEEGSWYVVPATREFIFHEDVNEIWAELTRMIGKAALSETLNINAYPDNLEDN